MRNIVLLQESHDPISSIYSSFTHFSYDYSSKLLYASTPSNTIVEYHVGKKQIIHEVDLLALDILTPDVSIVALHSMHNMGTVCAASSAGDIIVYDTQTKQVECVGIVDSGITTMAWSPDFEMVVMGTKKGTLIAMTKDWEVLTEVQPTHTVLSVTWRGDGAFFASCGLSSLGLHELCVWERSCAPHSRASLGTGESLISGSNLISWRPAGQIIAGVSPAISSSTPSSAQRVIFFERNGLRHGEFNLRGSVSKGEVTQLGWSCDSETLSALVDGTLQMWNSSNYHWALKKEIFLRAENEKEKADQLLGFEWDPEDPHCLRAFSKGGIFSEIKFTYEYTVCDVPIKENRYSTGVVDGNEIKFTPFRQVVIPPPMCSFSVKQTATVVSFAYGNPENEADPEVVVLSSDNVFSFYTKSKPTPLSPLKLLSSIASPSLSLNALRQPVWISPSLFAVQTKNGQDEIVQITFSHDFLSIASVTAHSPSSSSSHPHILRITRNFNSTNIIVELSDGSLQHYPPSSSSPLTTFPLPCIRIASFSLPSNSALTHATVGLTATGKLYINSTLLSSVCNSFFVQGTFLLFTTTNHKLHFLPLSSFSPSVPPTTESCEIERGGILVAAIAFDVRVVLQMPRGNLETIHPHTLCLALARTHLDLSPPAYQSAFTLLRKYRLDLNILYDYQPSSFLSHVHHFVSQLSTVEFLNLFISSLRKDVQKFYTDVEVTQDEQKLNIVCDALRGALIAADEAKYLLPVLTTYVKKDPAELGEALQLIQKLRDSPQGSATTASKALDYVIFLVDVDRLYDVALGLYDFDLVLMVAQKSQKDPKEYLPFLTSLQSMDTHTQRYVIDSQLGRWDSALRNLAAVGEDKLDEVIALTSRHALFQTAMEIYASNPAALRQVYSSYGDHLAGLGRSEAAGYAYLNSAQHEKALASFKECSKWREAMHAARLNGYNVEHLRNLAYQMAN